MVFLKVNRSTVLGSGGVLTFLAGLAAVYYSLTGAYGGAVLQFPTIVDSGSQQQNFSMPAAAADDCVTPNWPALPPGVLGIMFVDRPGVITVRLFNFSGAPVTPSPLPYRARTNACAK